MHFFYFFIGILNSNLVSFFNCKFFMFDFPPINNKIISLEQFLNSLCEIFIIEEFVINIDFISINFYKIN